MTTALPPETPIFTSEQRRRLGQVYSLILSWRNEATKNNHAKVDNSVSALDQINAPADLTERSE
jgi:hypothetical protein